MGKILLINTGPSGQVQKWAEAAARRVAEYDLSAVYVCPVPHADETARIVAGYRPVEALPGFGEKVEAFWKPEHRPLPFKEDLDKLRARVEPALTQVWEKHKKETVAVVSQRQLTVVMILFLLHMHNSHYGQIAQEDGAVNLFEVRDNTPSALYINDTCHLHGLI